MRPARAAGGHQAPPADSSSRFSQSSPRPARAIYMPFATQPGPPAWRQHPCAMRQARPWAASR